MKNILKILKNKKINNMKINPTAMIKSAFANAIHKLLEPNINIKRSQRWKFKDKYKLSDSEKLEIFDKIMEIHENSSYELVNYKNKKRTKKIVNKLREERGYKKKKRTSLDEFKKNNAV
jgi:hypothetical protein